MRVQRNHCILDHQGFAHRRGGEVKEKDEQLRGEARFARVHSSHLEVPPVHAFGCERIRIQTEKKGNAEECIDMFSCDPIFRFLSPLRLEISRANIGTATSWLYGY